LYFINIINSLLKVKGVANRAAMWPYKHTSEVFLMNIKTNRNVLFLCILQVIIKRFMMSAIQFSSFSLEI